MSMKHIKDYYKQITDDYLEMLHDIEDMEKLALTSMVEPERIEMMKETFAPIKDNWQKWSFMMFLLNMPNKKDKISKYKKQVKFNNNVDMLKENEESFKKFKNNNV